MKNYLKILSVLAMSLTSSSEVFSMNIFKSVDKDLYCQIHKVNERLELLEQKDKKIEMRLDYIDEIKCTRQQVSAMLAEFRDAINDQIELNNENNENFEYIFKKLSSLGGVKDEVQKIIEPIINDILNIKEKQKIIKDLFNEFNKQKESNEVNFKDLSAGFEKLKKEFGNTKQKLNQDFIEKFSSLDKKITENKEKYEKDLGSLNKELRKEIEGISKEFSKSLEEKTSALNLKMNNKIEEVRRHVDFAINRQEKLRKEVLKEISSVTATISTNVIVSLKSINNVFDVLKKFNFQEINTVITNAVNVLNRSIKEIDDLDGHADGLVVVNKENLFNRMEAEIEKSEAFNLKEAAGEKK